VTGGVAEGKSTVVRILEGLGLTSASADRIAAEVVSSPDVARAIEGRVGVHPSDRATLRERLANDPAARRAVNAIVHPSVARAVLASEVDVVEVPLLLETCLQGHFARVWVVTAAPRSSSPGLAARLGSEEEARRLVAAQLPTATKAPFADAIVRTNRPMRDVQGTVVASAIRQGLA
jgi:dephospho-CoA kinase